MSALSPPLLYVEIRTDHCTAHLLRADCSENRSESWYDFRFGSVQTLLMTFWLCCCLLYCRRFGLSPRHFLPCFEGLMFSCLE